MGTRSRVMAVACVFAVAAGVACSAGDSSNDTGGGGSREGATRDQVTNAGGVAYHGVSKDTVADAPAGLGDELPPTGPSVIKTADVSLLVGESRLHESIRAIVSIAGDHGGYVLSTEEQDQAQGRATVVVRVPAEAFETTLDDAEAVGKVTRESVTGEDVSQEFVDLDARLRNFEAQETVLLKLMARSSTVADTLRVQRELQDVQLEIERLRGRLRFLRDQTDLSTIAIGLSEEGVTVAPAGSLQRAWRRALHALTAIASGAVVAVVVLVPIGIVALLLLLFVRFAWVRLPSVKPRV